jgi:hypothetical protein
LSTPRASGPSSNFSNAARQKTFTDEKNLPANQQANFLNQKIVADDGMQGRLISDPSKTTSDPWPDPLEKAGNLKSIGYSAPPVVYLFGAGVPSQYIPVEDKADRLLAEVKQDANGEKRIPIPVFHCECEGSRPYFVCSAISPLLDIASGKLPGAPGPSASEICHATLGWIPFVGDAICSLIEDLIALALAPIVLIVAATAWFQAQLFDDLFITGPVSGEIAVGDSVIVTGRWVKGRGPFGLERAARRVHDPEDRHPAGARRREQHRGDEGGARGLPPAGLPPRGRAAAELRCAGGASHASPGQGYDARAAGAARPPAGARE